MLNFLGRRKARQGESSRIPDGLRVYAVGDVHGCKSQMVDLLDAIQRHRQGHTGLTHLVFLGDLVDRGPNSAGVLEYLLNSDLPADDVTFIMGNHEEFMLDCYDGRVGSYGPWLQYGGLETMASYGVTREEISSSDFDLAAVMKRTVSPDHIAFMRSFQDTLRLGDYLFLHAGNRPGTALEHQTPADLRWIRDEFLADERDYGFTVVHGHTISPKIERHRNRIGVDTGCFRSGILSALVLEGAECSALVENHAR
jgi:serine/threonine protein phosphatase 1